MFSNSRGINRYDDSSLPLEHEFLVKYFTSIFVCIDVYSWKKKVRYANPLKGGFPNLMGGVRT